MLNLRSDLYSRMVLSAQKDRELNKKFKYVVRTAYPEKIYSEKKISVEKPIVSSANEKKEGSSVTPSKFYRVPMLSKRSEKIDEKIDNIINNPQLLGIKKELDAAEELLDRIKLVDRKNPRLKILEQTISRIRTLIDDKMYL